MSERSERIIVTVSLLTGAPSRPPSRNRHETMAQPCSTLERGGNRGSDRRRVAAPQRLGSGRDQCGAVGGGATEPSGLG